MMPQTHAMPDPSRYRVPARTHRAEEEVKRSRFIATIGRASTVGEASAFVDRVRGEFPDATHNCWAYLIGPPGTSARVGMSDDGEPHGTAGRPMLAILQHSGIGDIVAVVTRYYGGTKLGTGGLVRAYGGGVQHALATLPVVDRVEWATLTLAVDYARVTTLQQLFPAFEAEILTQTYLEAVRFELRLPSPQRDAFRAAVLDATRGQARFDDDA
jgi:uncharacterized YigZ family protein